MRKRIIVFVIAVVFAAGLLPTTAFAEGDISELKNPIVVKMGNEDITIWNRVNLGQYHGEGMQWRILNIDDEGNAYLLSDKLTEERSFNDFNEVDWSKSGINKWLNNEYIASFGRTEYEQLSGEIALLTKEDAENPDYGFINNASRKYSGVNNAKWWLMTPGESSGEIYYVNEDGSIGQRLAGEDSYVRPAIRINLKNCDLWSHQSAVASYSEKAGKQVEVLDVPTLSGPNAVATYNGKTFNGSEVYDMPENGVTYLSEPVTNAGVYTVSVKTNDGYIFSDGKVTWEGQFEIVKADPEYELPKNVEIIHGDYLKDVRLPEGFSWMDGNIRATEVGSHSFKVKFTPADTINYNTIKNIDLSVHVGHDYVHKKIAAKIGIAGSEYDKCSRCGKIINKKTIKALKPAATKITKLTAATKAFTAKWAKKSYTGYQLRYSLKSSMASSKTVTITKAGTVSKKITKLKAKKKYYVQVRTYKTVNGKKYYSKWSAKKYVKTK